MIKIVDYHPDHLEKIELKSCHKAEVPKTVLTEAVTILKDDKPLAIIGAFAFIVGTYHIWGLVSEDVGKYPISFHKSCKSLLRFFESQYSPRRLQIDVRVDCPENAYWAELLGFEREGVMKNYGLDNSDYWLMSRCSWVR